MTLPGSVGSCVGVRALDAAGNVGPTAVVAADGAASCGPRIAPATGGSRSAPRVTLLARAWASTENTHAAELITWRGHPGTSPIAYYNVAYRRIGSRAWHTLAGRTTRTRVTLRGPAGTTYLIHVQAVDKAGKRSAIASHSVAIPLDDRDPRIHRSGWQEARRGGAYGGTVARGGRGATLSLRFTGHVIAVIGTRLRGGGRMLVTLDGLHPQTISAAGAPALRIVLTARQVHERSHVLRIRVLSGTVEIDALGIRREDGFGG